MSATSDRHDGSPKAPTMGDAGLQRNYDEMGHADKSSSSSLPSSAEAAHPDQPVIATDAEKKEGSVASTRPAMSIWQEIIFVAVICSTNIFTQASLGMTIPPINYIGNGLGVKDPGGQSWFTAAFSLTVGTFILISGRLGDMFGHKLLYVGGFFWFGFWSLIAGFTVYAKSGIFFDVCRALQGIGAAMMVPNGLAILGRTYPPGRRKDMVFSVFGATAPNGFLIGAVFSALLAQFLWWPWIFWIAAIASSVFGVLAILVVPATPVDRSSRQKFDFLGALTGVAGLVLFNVAWNQAPSVGWGNAQAIVLLIVGLLLFVVFVLIEKRTPQALIPMNVFSGDSGFVLGCMILSWSSFGIWVYYVYQFQLNLRHKTPLRAVAQTVPVGVSGCTAALTTGFLLGRFRTSHLMTVAMLAFCIGNILFGTMPVSQNYWIQTFLGFTVTPWGMDISFPAATILMSNFVDKAHQGIAASLIVTIVNYAISIGLGIAGTVESRVNRGGRDLLRGYRGAFYSAIGLSGMGVVFALYFVFTDFKHRRTSKA